MEKIWYEKAWEDYLFWQKQDKKTLKRINLLIKDIERNGHNGLGKTEPLKNNLSGWYSKRIDMTHRLVYRFDKEKNILEILSCKTHYDF